MLRYDLFFGCCIILQLLCLLEAVVRTEQSTSNRYMPAHCIIPHMKDTFEGPTIVTEFSIPTYLQHWIKNARIMLKQGNKMLPKIRASPKADLISSGSVNFKTNLKVVDKMIEKIKK